MPSRTEEKVNCTEVEITTRFYVQTVSKLDVISSLLALISGHVGLERGHEQGRSRGHDQILSGSAGRASTNLEGSHTGSDDPRSSAARSGGKKSTLRLHSATRSLHAGGFREIGSYSTYVERGAVFTRTPPRDLNRVFDSSL